MAGVTRPCPSRSRPRLADCRGLGPSPRRERATGPGRIRAGRRTQPPPTSGPTRDPTVSNAIVGRSISPDVPPPVSPSAVAAVRRLTVTGRLRPVPMPMVAVVRTGPARARGEAGSTISGAPSRCRWDECEADPATGRSAPIARRPRPWSSDHSPSWRRGPLGRRMLSGSYVTGRQRDPRRPARRGWVPIPAVSPRSRGRVTRSECDVVPRLPPGWPLGEHEAMRSPHHVPVGPPGRPTSHQDNPGDPGHEDTFVFINMGGRRFPPLLMRLADLFRIE
jgi:hypothetical protein